MGRGGASRLALLLVSATAILPYLPAITEHFIFDDIPAVLRNTGVVASSPVHLWKQDFWGGNLSSTTSHKSYRPLTTLTFWLQTKATTSPCATSLKIGNLLVHLINCLLLLQLLRAPGLLGILHRREQEELALYATLVFACHPLHVEPVVTVVGRADLLYTCFLLMACLVAIQANTPAVNMTLPLLSLASLLCKEQGVMVPAFWALAIIHKSRRMNIGLFSKILLLFPPLATLLLLALFRVWVGSFTSPTFQAGDNPAGALPTAALRTANYQYYWCLHLLLLAWPHWLCFDWALGCVPPITSPTDLRAMSLPTMWLLFGLLALSATREARKGKNTLLCSSALLALPFLLSTNLLVTVGFVVAERSLYLSVAGAALCLVRGWQLLRELLKPLLPCWLSYLLLPSLVLIFSLRSAARSFDWRTEVSLFTSGLAVCPANAKVWYNIAKKQVDLGESDMAVVSYREAVRLTPSYEHALNNLGNLEKARGDPQQAALLLQKATEVSPKFAAAHMNLGIVLQKLGQTEAAEHHYLAALSLRSPYPDCEYNLGNLYLKASRFDEAETKLRTASRLGHQLAWGNLVLLLEDRGREEEAHLAAAAAVQEFPENAELKFHLANSHGKRGEFAEGEATYLAALATRPRAVYHANLGVLYHRWGKVEQAAASYQAALALQPGLASARKNLARLQP